MRTWTIAAAVMLIGVTTADSGYKGPKNSNLNSASVMLVHSWYDGKCCHDKDCHPIPCEEIEKISDGWLWRDAVTKQRFWFPHDRLKASHDDACHVCVSPRTIPSGICLYMPLPA